MLADIAENKACLVTFGAAMVNGKWDIIITTKTLWNHF
jgi:hypothetical protein